MPIIHQNLAAGRWQKMNIAEQLGNIGSEYGRFKHWQEKGDFVKRDKALSRTIELIDLTIASCADKARLRELIRLREVISNELLSVDLEKYFLSFAILARSKR